MTTGDRTSPRLREEIEAREHRLADLDQHARTTPDPTAYTPLSIDRAWVQRKVDAIHTLLARDTAGARREIQKHIEDLQIAPAPEAGEGVIRITGRAKIDGLLGTEEAVRLQLVAGARNHRYQRCSSSPSI